ncbi:Uncharacterised protein [Mycobacteroides abscessus subsp. abscessus]|nr:Uncharacterised protein [Mycobacteroides abscessus subsp. abscessus]
MVIRSGAASSSSPGIGAAASVAVAPQRTQRSRSPNQYPAASAAVTASGVVSDMAELLGVDVHRGEGMLVERG